jgi:hypothetical protein
MLSTVLIEVLEVLFFGGIVGAAIVVLLTAVEDVRELFSKTPEQE